MEKNLAPLIKKKLESSLGLKNIEVINNSHFHQHHVSSPKSGNSHFQLIIKKNEMQNLNRIQIHRKIYNQLQEELKQFIHSIEIQIIE